MTTPVPHRREKIAVWLLRIDAIAHILAAVVVFLPKAVVAQWHEQLGLGAFPDAPIAWYLARGLPAWYAMHGALILVISCNVRRYLELIRIAMRLFAAYGILMVFVDLQAPMPGWWTFAEPVFVLAFSSVVLILLANSTDESREHNSVC